MELYTVIKQPLITEKATGLREKENTYVFKVDVRSDKDLIKQAVESLFKVKVVSVRTSVQRGKFRRFGRSVGFKSTWKKAMVQLQAGQKIDLFEGV